MFLLKDISKLYEPGVVVNETITSQHNTRRLLDMFNLLKTNFKFVFDTSLFFRFVVCDLCWPTIHGMFEAMNLETIDEYAKRIFKYSSDKEVDPTQHKGFLASCISHSSHRYAKGLKRYVKFSDREHKIFAACCFSFLANTTDLESTKTIFKLICQVFLHRLDDQICSNARIALQQLIEVRPNDKTDIIKAINEIYPDFVDHENAQNETSESFDTFFHVLFYFANLSHKRY